MNTSNERVNDATLVTEWSSPAWRERAVAWLDDELAAAGMARVGSVEQPHMRPWGTVLKAQTSHGVVWFKACGSTTAFEVGLYGVLEQVANGHCLRPIAADAVRGWMVLPDGGQPIGERLSGTELYEAMIAAVAQYGQLQRSLMPRQHELLGLGVTDMRPAIMPHRFAEALVAVSAFVEKRGSDSERATLEQVGALGESIARWCHRLSAMPGSASLDHNDLHPWNILGDPVRGAAQFYDWGDSVVAHPFASMLVPLSWAQGHLDVGLADARFLRLRDSYLSAFSDLAPHSELVETLEVACRVGKIARALTWARAMGSADADAPELFVTAPFRSLSSLLDASYLGGA